MDHVIVRAALAAANGEAGAARERAAARAHTLESDVAEARARRRAARA